MNCMCGQPYSYVCGDYRYAAEVMLGWIWRSTQLTANAGMGLNPQVQPWVLLHERRKPLEKPM